MSSQEERDFEPPRSTTPKRKAMMSPRGSRPLASPGEEEAFGRPKSWQQYDRRTTDSSEEQLGFSPFGGGQKTRSYHHHAPPFRSSDTAHSSSQSIHRVPSTEQPTAYPDPDTMDEDIGADYLSLDMPLGSFADDSPPRKARTPLKTEGKKLPFRSPKASPSRSTVYHPFGGPASYPHPYYGARSPRGSSYPPVYMGGQLPRPSTSNASSSHPGRPCPTSTSPTGVPPPPQHPHYAYPHGYPHYYPGYPPHPGADHHPHWTSPQAFDEAMPPRRSPPPPMDGSISTPEKTKPMRSPFRSPPLSQTKGKSPMFHGSPAIGNYGSFGMMDTPGGTLAAEFSPMGPMLHIPFHAEFGDAGPSPPQLPMSRSHSEDMEDGSTPAASPFSGFMREFDSFAASNSSDNGASGGLQGVPRSPLRSEKHAAHAVSSVTRSDRPSVKSVTVSQPSLKRPPARSANDGMASPLVSGAKPRKLWNGPLDSAGHLRMELGNTSTQTKSLDSINNMMRNQGCSPTGATFESRHFGQNHPPQQSAYRSLNTPIKFEPSPVHGKGMSTGHKRSFPPSTISKTSKIARSGGKENKGTPGAKRHPCNCKKSKCLKLYCECFSAELFCEGCNCGDCKNIPEFASLRDKAIKDTRAKNPNAFKPRIGLKGPPIMAAMSGASPQSGHNMGCRCKRSECLKKYCECFQAGVMCSGKCKCKDCMNYAGSQKLIDKRRKIKDQRGAELAMKVADQTWKGQQPSRKLPVARPAVHSMRPMPSPVATSGGRMPTTSHMMNPSPSGHAPPYHMRPPFLGHHHYSHMGYSPIGMPPHVSPPGYGMYPPHPPLPTPVHVAKKSPTASSTKMEASNTKAKPVTVEKNTSESKAGSRSPLQRIKNSSTKSEITTDTGKCKNGEYDSEVVHDKSKSLKETVAKNTFVMKPSLRNKPGIEGGSDDTAKPTPSVKASSALQPTPNDKDTDLVRPTPSEKPAPIEVTPMPPTPAPAVRVAYDPSTNRKKHRIGDASEPTFPYFGNLPQQPKTTMLTVFSFLSNSDLTNAAGFVCKSWNRLSKDEALWNFSPSP